MGKTGLFLVFASGMLVLFHIGGLITTNPFLNVLLNPQNFTSSDLWSLILVIVGSVGAAILVGFVTRNPEIVAMSAFVPSFFLFMWDFVEIFNVFEGQNRALALLVFSPIILLFFFTAVEFWRGKD